MPWYESGGGGAFDPTPVPVSLNQPAHAVHNGELWLFGGTNESVVYSYDPYANAWTQRPSLPSNEAPGAKAAIIGGLAYIMTDAAFWSYDLTDGTITTLASPAGGEQRYRNLIPVGGLIYWALGLNGEGQVYDPATNSWSAITPAPTGESFGPAAVATDGTYIYSFQTDPGADFIYRYEPGADTWTTIAQNLLASDAERTINAGMAHYAGKLYMVGGPNQDGSFSSASQITHLFNIGTGAYEAFADTNHFWDAPAIGFVDDILILAQGTQVEVFASEPPAIVTTEATLQVEHEPTNRQLAITHRVDWPVEAQLAVTWSTSRVTGDAGAILRVQHQTITGDQATLRIVHDPVTPDGVVGSLPATGPVVTGSLQERVGSGVTGTLQREDGTHPTANDGVFSMTEAAGDGTNRTFTVRRSLAVAPYGKGWQRQGGVPISTLTTPNPGDALEDAILPELVKVPILTAGGIQYGVPPDVDPILTSFEAPLGARTPATQDNCDARMPIDESGRQTRMDLAREVVEQAGFTLIVLGNIPNAERFVDRDYRTKDATAASVLSDMLLASNPRVWYTTTAVFVDGRVFTAGPGTTDPTTFLSADLLMDDGASWQDQAGRSEPEPVLADYTDQCEQRNPNATPDPEHDEDVDVPSTFETLENGTYSWIERSGQRVGPFGDVDDSDWRATTHTLTKRNGQLVRETAVSREQFRRSYTSGINTTGIVAMTTVENEYHPVCGEALTSRSERTHQRKRVTDIPNVSNTLENTEEAPYTPDENHELIYEAIPTWYVEEETFVEQRWNAEGWLRARHETTRQLSGMLAKPQFDEQNELSGYEVTLTYRTDRRHETYLPVGRGLWHIATMVANEQDRPVYELVNPDAVEGEEDYGERELVDVQRVRVQNHYTVVTDQAPPSVSCGGSDPRNPDDPCGEGSGDSYADCIAAQTTRWEIDHADWEARQAHDGAKRVWTVQANRLLPGVRVGQLRGGALITGVTHDLQAVGGTTTLEVAEWLA